MIKTTLAPGFGALAKKPDTVIKIKVIKSSVNFEHGEKTCDIGGGGFCRWFTSRSFGTQPICYLTGEDLYEEHGWFQRSPECTRRFRSVK